MPLYEYRCAVCGATETRVVQVRARRDEDLPRCPQHDLMARVPSAPAKPGEPIEAPDGTVRKREHTGYNYLAR